MFLEAIHFVGNKHRWLLDFYFEGHLFNSTLRCLSCSAVWSAWYFPLKDLSPLLNFIVLSEFLLHSPRLLCSLCLCAQHNHYKRHFVSLWLYFLVNQDEKKLLKYLMDGTCRETTENRLLPCNGHTSCPRSTLHSRLSILSGKSLNCKSSASLWKSLKFPIRRGLERWPCDCLSPLRFAHFASFE